MTDTASSPLGRSVDYRADYAPELLFPILRGQKRQEIGIDQTSLPFVGEDIWNAYEISWLNLRGKPVVALGEFRVPADSPCLIESKSLKLYLNSFNQTRFARLDDVREALETDLSRAAGKKIAVVLTGLVSGPERRFALPQGTLLDHLDIDIADYQPVPSCLQIDAARSVEDQVLYSHLLKSNCLVTGQPDWAMLAVRYSGPAIVGESLLRYLVSFRQHNEFHEQCVERIFNDIRKHCAPMHLAVWARYTRRGGLDINPARATRADWLPNNVSEIRQ